MDPLRKNFLQRVDILIVKSIFTLGCIHVFNPVPEFCCYFRPDYFQCTVQELVIFGKSFAND
jgi:hypothetical protein